MHTVRYCSLILLLLRDAYAQEKPADLLIRDFPGSIATVFFRAVFSPQLRWAALQNMRGHVVVYDLANKRVLRDIFEAVTAHHEPHGWQALRGLGARLWAPDLLSGDLHRSGTVPRNCYRAANWVLLGRTTGRGKNDQTNRPNRSIKEVLGYPLTRRFRQLLGNAKVCSRR